MRQTLLEVIVYPLLLINIAAGFFMFVATHSLILVMVGRLNQNGTIEELQLGPFTYFERSASNIGVIFMAILALIAVPLLERHYTNSIENNRLFRRFVRVFGIQLIFLGIVDVVTRLIASVSLSWNFVPFILIGATLVYLGPAPIKHSLNVGFQRLNCFLFIPISDRIQNALMLKVTIHQIT